MSGKSFYKGGEIFSKCCWSALGFDFSICWSQKLNPSCIIFEEYLLSIILVARLKVTGLWCDHDVSLKPTVFLRR